MSDLPAPLNPPERLLCGPGPSNIDPRVLEAMQRPMLGHLDPDFHKILEDLIELLKAAYRRSDGLTIALSASGTSGMEAGLASLAEPGETVIVATCGFFGNRMIDIARRHRLNVIELRAPFGQAVPNDQIVEALRLRERSDDDLHRPVPLRPILDGLAVEFAEPARLKGIRLRVTSVGGAAFTHPVLFSGMLRNLIRNAIDYTPPGGRVFITSRRCDSEQRLEVRDTGVGMRANVLSTIFQAASTSSLRVNRVWSPRMASSRSRS